MSVLEADGGTVIWAVAGGHWSPVRQVHKDGGLRTEIPSQGVALPLIIANLTPVGATRARACALRLQKEATNRRLKKLELRRQEDALERAHCEADSLKESREAFLDLFGPWADERQEPPIRHQPPSVRLVAHNNARTSIQKRANNHPLSKPGNCYCLGQIHLHPAGPHLTSVADWRREVALVSSLAYETIGGGRTPTHAWAPLISRLTDVGRRAKADNIGLVGIETNPGPGKPYCKACRCCVNPEGTCSVTRSNHVFSGNVRLALEKARVIAREEEAQYETRMRARGWKYDELAGEWYDPELAAKFAQSYNDETWLEDWDDLEDIITEVRDVFALQTSLPFRDATVTYDSETWTYHVKFPEVSDPLEEPLLNHEQALVFKSGLKIRHLGGACGTGKTIRCPDRIRQGGKMVLMIPTIKAVQNAYKFYSKGNKVWGRAGGATVSTPNTNMGNADLIIMTTGAAMMAARKKEWLPLVKQGAKLFIDEAHTESSMVQRILDDLYFAKVAADVTLATATPSFTQFGKWFGAKRMAQTWSITEELSLPKNAKQRHIVAVQERLWPLTDNGSILVIGPSLPALANWELVFPRRYQVWLSRKRCELFDSHTCQRTELGPASEVDIDRLAHKLGQDVVYLSTPVTEVGVTIPELKNVISVNQVQVIDQTRCIHCKPFTRNGCCRNEEENYLRAVLPCNWASAAQRAGRTNRTCAGNVVLVGKPKGDKFSVFDTDGNLVEEQLNLDGGALVAPACKKTEGSSPLLKRAPSVTACSSNQVREACTARQQIEDDNRKTSALVPPYRGTLALIPAFQRFDSFGAYALGSTVSPFLARVRSGGYGPHGPLPQAPIVDKRVKEDMWYFSPPRIIDAARVCTLCGDYNPHRTTMRIRKVTIPTNVEVLPDGHCVVHDVTDQRWTTTLSLEDGIVWDPLCLGCTARTNVVIAIRVRRGTRLQERARICALRLERIEREYFEHWDAMHKTKESPEGGLAGVVTPGSAGLQNHLGRSQLRFQPSSQFCEMPTVPRQPRARPIRFGSLNVDVEVAGRFYIGTPVKGGKGVSATGFVPASAPAVVLPKSGTKTPVAGAIALGDVEFSCGWEESFEPTTLMKSDDVLDNYAHLARVRIPAGLAMSAVPPSLLEGYDEYEKVIRAHLGAKRRQRALRSFVAGPDVTPDHALFCYLSRFDPTEWYKVARKLGSNPPAYLVKRELRLRNGKAVGLTVSCTRRNTHNVEGCGILARPYQNVGGLLSIAGSLSLCWLFSQSPPYSMGKTIPLGRCHTLLVKSSMRRHVSSKRAVSGATLKRLNEYLALEQPIWVSPVCGLQHRALWHVRCEPSSGYERRTVGEFLEILAEDDLVGSDTGESTVGSFASDRTSIVAVDDFPGAFYVRSLQMLVPGDIRHEWLQWSLRWVVGINTYNSVGYLSWANELRQALRTYFEVTDVRNPVDIQTITENIGCYCWLVLAANHVDQLTEILNDPRAVPIINLSDSVSWSYQFGMDAGMRWVLWRGPLAPGHVRIEPREGFELASVRAIYARHWPLMGHPAVEQDSRAVHEVAQVSGVQLSHRVPEALLSARRVIRVVDTLFFLSGYGCLCMPEVRTANAGWSTLAPLPLTTWDFTEFLVTQALRAPRAVINCRCNVVQLLKEPGCPTKQPLVITSDSRAVGEAATSLTRSLALTAKSEAHVLCDNNTPLPPIVRPTWPEGFQGLGRPRVKFEEQYIGDYVFAGNLTAAPYGRSKESRNIYQVTDAALLSSKNEVNMELDAELDRLLYAAEQIIATFPEGAIVDVSTWDHADRTEFRKLIFGPAAETCSPWNHKIDVDPRLEDKIALAKIRLVAMFVKQSNHVIHISNGRVESFENLSHQVDALHWLQHYPAVSSTGWGQPACENVFVRAGFLNHRWADFKSAMQGGLYVYGSDESILSELPILVPRLWEFPWKSTPWQVPQNFGPNTAARSCWIRQQKDFSFVEVRTTLPYHMNEICQYVPAGAAFQDVPVIPRWETCPFKIIIPSKYEGHTCRCKGLPTHKKKWFTPKISFVSFVLLISVFVSCRAIGPWRTLAITIIGMLMMIYSAGPIVHWWDSMRPDQFTAAVDKLEVTSAYADLPRHEYALIVTFGTRGDQIPLAYMARLAATAGLKVAYYNIKHDTAADLRKLANGDPYSQIPAFLEAKSIGDAGWGHVFLPFVKTTGPHTVYSLTPSRRWIKPLHFGTTIVGKLMALTAEWADPGVTIGCLPDSKSGRSADGWSILVKRKSTKEKDYYAVGSDTMLTINHPGAEPLPDGDHAKLLTSGRMLFCHGGAGTMQTAAMSGCTARSLNSDLDRRYYRDLTPADVVFRSPRPFLALIRYSLHGFEGASWLDLLALVSISGRLLNLDNALIVMSFVARLIVLATGLLKNWHMLITFWVTLLNGWGRLAIPSISLSLWGLMVLFQHPALLYPGLSGLLITMVSLSQYGLHRVAKDISASKSNWRIKFFGLENVRWLPGHVALFNVKTGKHYEGGFRDKRPAYGAAFVFRETDRPADDAAHSFQIPCIVDERMLSLIIDSQVRYSARDNCQTLAWQAIQSAGLFHLIPFLLSIAIGYHILGVWYLTMKYGGMIKEEVMPMLAAEHARADYQPRISGDGSHVCVPIKTPPTTPVVKEGVPLTTPVIKEGVPGGDEDSRAVIQSVLHLPIEGLVEVLASLAIMGEEDGMPQEYAIDAAIMALRRLYLAQPDVAKPFERAYVQKKGVAKQIEKIYKQCRLVIDSDPFAKEFFHFLTEVTRSARFTGALIEAMLLHGLKWVLLIPSVTLGTAVVTLVNDWIDEVLPVNDLSRRMKSVWSLGGVFEDPQMTAMRQFLANAELMKFEQVSGFDEAYDSFIKELQDHYPRERPDKYKVGGDMYRAVHLFKHPVMSEQEAKLLEEATHGPLEDELGACYAHIDPRVWPELTARTQRYLDLGAAQGTDGVNLMHIYPSLIAKSIERYSALGVPAPLSADDRQLAEEIARSMVNRWPNAYGKMRPTEFEAIYRYSKLKYSPGSPFIGHYKSRAEMYDAGWKPAIISAAMDRIKNGRYGHQISHAFGKSQVVDGGKILYQGKNARTVIAQDLLSYYVDQFAQFERNKRDVWRETMVGIGMPLNQNMEFIFKQLRQYGQILALDGSQYDSTLGPFAFEILAQLAAYGSEDMPGHAVISNILRSKYEAMMKGYIVGITIDPESGVPRIHQKMHGGGTGQSATSWDNTASLKGLLCATWVDYWRNLGRQVSPKDFFDEVFLANTGDDNMIGFPKDYKIDDMEAFITFAAARGLFIRVEGEGPDALYLGHGSRYPTTSDTRDMTEWLEDARTRSKWGYIGKNLEPSLPELVVYQSVEALLLRRTAFRYYQSDPLSVRTVLLERSIGHAMLTAYDRSLYSMFLHEYLDDVRSFLGPYRSRVSLGWDDGLGIQKLVLDGNKKPLWGPDHNPRYHAHWLRIKKQLKFPEYREVLRIHHRPAIQVLNRDEIRRAKLRFGLGSPDDALKEWITVLRELTDGIPRELTRAMPGIDMLYPEPNFDTVHRLVEHFIYSMNEKEVEQNPERFSQLVSQSPYGSACHSNAFLAEIVDNKGFLPRTEARREELVGAMATITTIYYFLSWVDAFLYRLPIIGSIYGFWILYMTRLPKIYGFLNLIQWHATGRSSTTISQLMPRDPYTYQKQVAVFTVDALFPWIRHLLFILGYFLEPTANFVTLVSDSIADFWVRNRKVRSTTTFGKSNYGDNEWLAYTSEYVAELREPKSQIVVSAPTATGKSTWLMAAMIESSVRVGGWNLIHLVPRRVLRDDTQLPSNSYRSQILKQGVPKDPIARHYIMTYGHFIQRIAEFNAVDDVIVFDEFHETSGEMIEAVTKTRDFRRMFMSATPMPLPELNGTPRFTPEVKGKGYKGTTVKLNGSVMDKVLYLFENHPEASDRVLVVVPTLKKVDETIAGLQYLKLGEVSEFSSRNRVMSKTAKIIVSTPMIDAGYDAKPPFTSLVDSGLDIYFDRGTAPFIAGTTTEKAKQRLGRINRLRPGIAIIDPIAGTGKHVKTYPAPARLANAEVAEFFEIPPLEIVSGDGHDTAPITAVMKVSLKNLRQLSLNKTDDVPVSEGAIPTWSWQASNHVAFTEEDAIRSLQWVGLANLSGVTSRDLPRFWHRHMVMGQDLNEDYAWMEIGLREIGWQKPVTLTWALISNLLLCKPFLIRIGSTERTYEWPVPVLGSWEDLFSAPTSQPSRDDSGKGLIKTLAAYLCRSGSDIKVKDIQDFIHNFNRKIPQPNLLTGLGQDGRGCESAPTNHEG